MSGERKKVLLSGKGGRDGKREEEGGREGAGIKTFHSTNEELKNGRTEEGGGGSGPRQHR